MSGLTLCGRKPYVRLVSGATLQLCSKVLTTNASNLHYVVVSPDLACWPSIETDVATSILTLKLTVMLDSLGEESNGRRSLAMRKKKGWAGKRADGYICHSKVLLHFLPQSDQSRSVLMNLWPRPSAGVRGVWGCCWWAHVWVYQDWIAFYFMNSGGLMIII